MEKAGYFRQDETIQITQAYTIDEYRQALSLVHDCFVASGIIQPEPSGLRVRVFDLIPETALYVAKCDNKTIGVTGLVLDGPQVGLPCDCAFKNVNDSYRNQGKKLCEGTDWAVCREYRQTPVLMMLMQRIYADAIKKEQDYLLAAVSPEHAELYNLLSFEQIGEKREYGPGDSVILVALDLEAESKYQVIQDWFVRENPWLR